MTTAPTQNDPQSTPPRRASAAWAGTAEEEVAQTPLGTAQEWAASSASSLSSPPARQAAGRRTITKHAATTNQSPGVSQRHRLSERIRRRQAWRLHHRRRSSLATVGVTITNHSSKRSDYLITVAVESANGHAQYDTADVYVQNPRIPCQTTSQDRHLAYAPSNLRPPPQSSSSSQSRANRVPLTLSPSPQPGWVGRTTY